MRKSKEIDKKIIDLLNRTELRDGEEIIDNRDSAISKELGVPVKYVYIVIEEYLSLKREKINKIVNAKYELQESGMQREIDACNEINFKLMDEVNSLKEESLKLQKENKKLTELVKDYELQKPHLYTERRRVFLAKEMMLKGSTDTITASLLGYSRSKSLKNLFLRLEGISLKEWRVQNNI